MKETKHKKNPPAKINSVHPRGAIPRREDRDGKGKLVAVNAFAVAGLYTQIISPLTQGARLPGWFFHERRPIGIQPFKSCPIPDFIRPIVVISRKPEPDIPFLTRQLQSCPIWRQADPLTRGGSCPPPKKIERGVVRGPGEVKPGQGNAPLPLPQTRLGRQTLFSKQTNSPPNRSNKTT